MVAFPVCRKQTALLIKKIIIKSLIIYWIFASATLLWLRLHNKQTEKIRPQVSRVRYYKDLTDLLEQNAREVQFSGGQVVTKTFNQTLWFKLANSVNNQSPGNLVIMQAFIIIMKTGYEKHLHEIHMMENKLSKNWWIKCIKLMMTYIFF